MPTSIPPILPSESSSPSPSPSDFDLDPQVWEVIAPNLAYVRTTIPSGRATGRHTFYVTR